MCWFEEEWINVCVCIYIRYFGKEKDERGGKNTESDEEEPGCESHGFNIVEGESYPKEE